MELLAAWYQSFRERLNDPTDLDGARRMARSWVNGEKGCAAYLLLRRAEHKGEPETPVSLCITNRETPHTRTISMVYTPAEHGCKGYATRLVASVTQIVLAVKRYCCLFTDLANPHRHLFPPSQSRLILCLSADMLATNVTATTSTTRWASAHTRTGTPTQLTLKRYHPVERQPFAQMMMMNCANVSLRDQKA